MATPHEILLTQIQNRVNRRDKVKADREASSTKRKKRLQDIINLGLTLATAGGTSALSLGLKGLSKFDKLKKVIDASKGLQKAVKFLDVGSKTTRLGTHAAKFGNKALNRLISDIIVKDTETMRDEDKLAGYGTDLATTVASYGKSFVEGAVNPVSGLPYDEPGAIPIEESAGESIIDQGGVSSIEPNVASNVPSGPTFSQQSALNQLSNPFPNMLGYSTDPHQTQSILGSIISQDPSGYKGGEAYYNIIDDIMEK
tara:strand:- start:6010 stop:6777 length:768 start_codon:yes stop_codon:yes gene_type:complete